MNPGGEITLAVEKKMSVNNFPKKEREENRGGFRGFQGVLAGCHTNYLLHLVDGLEADGARGVGNQHADWAHFLIRHYFFFSGGG